MSNVGIAARLSAFKPPSYWQTLDPCSQAGRLRVFLLALRGDSVSGLPLVEDGLDEI